jgi:hypothetical protein
MFLNTVYISYWPIDRQDWISEIAPAVSEGALAPVSLLWPFSVLLALHCQHDTALQCTALHCTAQSTPTPSPPSMVCFILSEVNVTRLSRALTHKMPWFEANLVRNMADMPEKLPIIPDKKLNRTKRAHAREKHIFQTREIQYAWETINFLACQACQVCSDNVQTCPQVPSSSPIQGQLPGM